MTTAAHRQVTSRPDADAEERRLRQFSALARAMTKGFLRDKGALFFAFLFPLLFLAIGGLLFGRAADRTTIGVVGGGPVVEALAASQAVDLTRLGTAQEAADRLASGDLPAYVVEQGDQLTLRFAANGLTGAGTARGLVEGVVSEQNVAATGQPPRFVLDTREVRSDALAPIQFLTPGILSWASAMAAVFGVALTLVSWRRNHLLRRLMLAPVRPIDVLASRVVVVLGVTLVQAALFIGIALLPMFGLTLSGQWWLAIPLLLLGTMAYFTIGMLVGAVFETEESATGAGNLIIMPMALLSGSFFPAGFLPSWLRVLTNVLPMKHLSAGMTDVMVRGRGLDAVIGPAAFLIGFTVVMGLLAARVFKWED